jgi:hypothetical protein
MLAVAGVCALTLVSAGCGAAGSSSTPSVQRPVTLSQAQPLDTQVGRMVLEDGDLAGWSIAGHGAEELADQLVPPTTAGADVTNSLVRRHWKASYHTILRHGTGVVYSDANVFDSAAGAGRIWNIERTAVVPGQRSSHLAVPPGAPPRTVANFVDTGKLGAYELGWSQGPVIGLVIVYVHNRLAPAREKDTLALMAQAATKQSNRIAQVLEDHAAALAAG